IGDGLNYQPSSSSEAWNREAKDRYYEWLEVASVRGPDIHTGCEIERMLWSQSRVAGDVGWIFVSRGSESRIQIVPSENIVTPDGKHNQKNIYDGVEFDAFGRPVAYHVLSHGEKDGRRGFTRIKAEDFVFLPHDLDPNGARGVSCYV